MEHGFSHSPPKVARRLFAPIAPSYERWARMLGMGQDGRWRRAMVEDLGAAPSARILDVAGGTGSIARLLEAKGHEVVLADQSIEMAKMAHGRGAVTVVAAAERLPFGDGSFGGLTFGYLLRYVDDVEACLMELARVVGPGGAVGMVEFGRPSGVWRLPWRVYTRAVLPVAGLFAPSGWRAVGRFLGPSIDAFASRYPPDVLAAVWEKAGLDDVGYQRMSLGGGIVMWGRKP